MWVAAYCGARGLLGRVAALYSWLISMAQSGCTMMDTTCRNGLALQVSGLRFKFDPDQPPGQRIVPGSVYFLPDVDNDGADEDAVPLDMNAMYKVGGLWGGWFVGWVGGVGWVGWVGCGVGVWVAGWVGGGRCQGRERAMPLGNCSVMPTSRAVIAWRR